MTSDPNTVFGSTLRHALISVVVAGLVTYFGMPEELASELTLWALATFGLKGGLIGGALGGVTRFVVNRIGA